MIEFEDFTFYYSNTERPALENIDLHVTDGEFLLISGPSGSGKSSICRCLNGLIPHFYGGRVSGRVEVQGLDVAGHPTKELAMKVGMVFQDPENQLVTVDVEREIAFGLENLRFSENMIAKRIEESLDAVGIAHLRRRQLQELSGGEKQKIALASVLALHPSVLVLDEPTSQLDPKGAEEILTVVERLNDELGITVILVEHRLDRVVHHADRLLIMQGGRIFVDGDPRKVLRNGEVESVGVGVPPVVRLVKRLANRVDRDIVPLTVKEARPFLDEAFKGVHNFTELKDRQPEGKLIIEVENLSYRYPEGTTALRNVNLKIHSGEFVSIIGRNGSGKTTLLKHLNGLLRPTAGKVVLKGVDTVKASAAELAQTVGYVFQNPNDHLTGETVVEDIKLSLGDLGLRGGEVEQRVTEILDEFNLTAYREQYPRYLSGGEKQKLAVASVLVRRPEVFVLDEPTRGIEYKVKSELMQSLDSYRRNGNVVILVTHDIETIAEYSDRVILLSEGRVIMDGPKRETLSKALLFSPQINRLVQAYEKYGVPTNILTVKDALSVM